MSYSAAKKVANKLDSQLKEIAVNQGLENARVTVLGTDLNSLVQGFLIMEDHHEKLNELFSLMNEVLSTEHVDN